MLKLQAILKDKGSMQDGTRKIVLECQEHTPEDLLEVLKSNNKIGWFVFSESKLEQTDIPETPVEFKGDKSPSQRLRGVLYKYWELNTGKQKTFEDFYKSQMEKFIETIKEKIN